MSEKPGSKSHPYMYDVYCSMVQQGCWNGSWVFSSSEGTVYITANQSVERDNDSGYLGSQDNPFSGTAYSEMMLAQTWQGGYVQHGDEPETIIYHRSYEEQNSACGCGCGCGSGSGTGCGCGSGASYVYSGHEDIMTAHNGDVKVSLSWGTGYTKPFPSRPIANLFIHVHVVSPFKVKRNTLNAVWGDGYNVTISGTLEYNEGDSITIQNLKPTSFEIPEFYRGLPED